MTREGIAVLRAICQLDYKAYLPQGSSVAAFGSSMPWWRHLPR